MSQQMFGNPIFDSIIQKVQENAIRQADSLVNTRKRKELSLAKSFVDLKYKDLHEKGVKRMREEEREDETRVPPPIITSPIQE